MVVEEIGDLWALERAGVVSGLYHVLGGHLSPLDGIGPERLNIGRLIERAVPPVTEILLALNATVEGQSTAHYLTEQLQGRGITVSRLAQGVPIGGELDYLDEGTLAAAIKSRRIDLLTLQREHLTLTGCHGRRSAGLSPTASHACQRGATRRDGTLADRPRRLHSP